MLDKKTLYITRGSGNSIKPMLVLSMTQQKCSAQYIDVLAGETRTPAYLQINSQGVVPYLQFDDESGLAESNAIAWYLAENTSLMPQTPLARAQTIRWMNFEQTALEANISPVRFFTSIVPELEDDYKDMIPVWRERGNEGLVYLDSYLIDKSFVADDKFGIADICVFGYTHLANEGGFNLSEYPEIEKWIGRVEDQPGYVPINQLLDGTSDIVQPLAA